MRCEVCKKKISSCLAVSLKCVCGTIVCQQHKFPDQHSCTKDNGRDLLKKRLPRVVPEKVIKI